MESATANLNNYRQSPRKVRLLADLVRGKTVPVAVASLRFATKRATGPIITLIQSAVANAKNKGLKLENLVVEQITVNAGQVLKRSMPMSRGRAFGIHKRTSHISVTVAEREPKVKPAKTAKTEKVKKTVKAENK